VQNPNSAITNPAMRTGQLLLFVFASVRRSIIHYVTIVHQSAQATCRGAELQKQHLREMGAPFRFYD